LYKQHFGCHRMLLHAWRLRFAHPATGVPMQVVAPLDDAYAGLFQRFGWALPVEK
jgi:tRNA pseudouridine65 synthase